MTPVPFAALLVALATSSAPATSVEPPLPPAGDRLEPGPDEPAFKLYNAGVDRLLITGNGHHVRLAREPGGSPGDTQFSNPQASWTLRGGRGRYVVTGPEGLVTQLDMTAHGIAAGGEHTSLQCPVDCDTDTTPPPADFTEGPGIPGARRVDIRPASCRSYFSDYAPIERGSRIEAALSRQGAMHGMSPTVRTFPQADWYNDTELVVMHSRDLASDSLDSVRHPGALYERLLTDAEALVSNLIEPLETEGHVTIHDGVDRTRIEATPERQVVMTILVRHGIASPAHIAQIAAARRELARRHGIELRVMEIP